MAESTPLDQGPAQVDLTKAKMVKPAAVEVNIPNISQVPRVQPKDPPKPPAMPAITGAGVDLVKWLLVMISIFVIFCGAWIWLSENAFAEIFDRFSKNIPSQGPALVISKDLLEQITTERSQFREFWLKIFQMVLLNVLLPVLTALLGYVFGSRHQDLHETKS